MAAGCPIAVTKPSIQSSSKQVTLQVLPSPQPLQKELCRVTHHPNPMALDPPWTWPKSTFRNLVSYYQPRAPSFCAVSTLPRPSSAHREIVLLTFAHAVPASWNKCPDPSSPSGEPQWVLYHPDHVWFSCVQSFSKYVLACQAQDAMGIKDRFSPFLLGELPTTPAWNPPTSTPLSLLSSHKCVCTVVYVYRYVYVWLCMYICTHVHTHIFCGTDDFGLWWLVGELVSSIRLWAFHNQGWHLIIPLWWLDPQVLSL